MPHTCCGLTTVNEVFHLSDNWEKEPTILSSQAAVIFNCSKRRFRAMLQDGLADEIRFWDTPGGRRIHLRDTIKAAYPGISDTALHLCALEFTTKLRMDRKVKRGGEARL